MKRVTLSRIVLSCALFFGIMCQAQTITDPKPGNDSAARSEPLSDWLADSNLLSKASPDEERAHVERIRRLQTLQSQSAEIHESAGAEVEADIGTETVVPAAPAVQGNSLRA